MSKRNCDSKGRFRCKTIAFRVSPEEDILINNLVRIAGTTKQEYLTNNMLRHEITVVGNTRVFKGLKMQMEYIYKELSRLSSASELTDELIALIKTVSVIVNDMNSTKGVLN